MLRAMFSGVSGLRSHQTMLDVVANNIANVNTSGFKASRVTFQEAISQVLRGSSGGSDVVRAGINPVQLGLGVNVAAIDGVFTQGATQLTGRTTDMAIQGEGFFVMDVGGEQKFTRAGAFNLDQGGRLVGSNGSVVQGWLADENGKVDVNRSIEDIVLPAGQTIDPITTGQIDIGGNLPVAGAIGENVTTSITVFDSLGQSQRMSVSFTNTGTNAWDVQASYVDSAGVAQATPAAAIPVTFGSDGQLATVNGTAVDATNPAEIALTGITFGNGSDPQDVTIKLDGDVPSVQYGGPSTIEARDQDGQQIGHLRGFTFGNDGVITGQFSNGEAKTLGFLALATFNNPGGLRREGESYYAGTGNSGVPLLGPPGDNASGLINAGALEMSNVDLAQEFTNLIIAQRGFQANSRAITTSDEVLSELVNLKR